MPQARYKFIRDSSGVAGISSNQRPSTDAINAVNAWAHAAQGRSFNEVSDDDETFVADLTWNDADDEAGPSLDDQCVRLGVKRVFVR
jgi:hypothetical protein